MAISLRLAASNFRMGLFFFILGPTSRLRETLDCFARTRRDWSTFFDSKDTPFECKPRDTAKNEREFLGAHVANVRARLNCWLQPREVRHFSAESVPIEQWPRLW